MGVQNGLSEWVFRMGFQIFFFRMGDPTLTKRVRCVFLFFLFPADDALVPRECLVASNEHAHLEREASEAVPIELVHRDEAELTLLTAEGASRRTSQTRIKGEIWEKWGAAYGRNGWVGETQKNRLKGEIWEKRRATYGRNGWVGETQKNR